MAEIAVAETPLAAQLAAAAEQLYRGAQTPLRFAGTGELEALLQTAGVFDRGYRSFLRAAGKDRVRWLNGMVTQAVKSMAPGQVGYTLVLNPQGRIQGDADVYCHEDSLLLETDRSQAQRLLTHLRRFIIMDDVKLDELDASATALGIAGPQAAAILAQLDAPAPEAGTFRSAQIAGAEVRIAAQYAPLTPRYELHLPAGQARAVWQALAAAGATPCGTIALEQLRVLEGVPQFDVDFSDRHLPQEVNLFRALNFTKGCYIGQEIVERIRSRAAVHRALRQFQLQGSVPAAAPGQAVELRSGGAPAGELTSIAAIALPGFQKILALGVARIEALEKSESGTEPLQYAGGTATVLAAPPVPALN